MEHEYLDISASKLTSILNFHAENGESIILTGPPGIGKSDLVRAASEKAGRTLIYHDTASSDPTDIPGLPFLDVKGKKLDRVVFNKFKKAGKLTVFFDEVFQGVPAVLNTIAPVFLEKRIGDEYLPEDTWVVGATNRSKDRAGTSRPPSHLPNRVTMVGLGYNNDDWRQWAIKTNLPSVIISFAAFRPSAMHDFDPARMVNATPRQWEWVGRHLEQLKALKEEEMLAVLSGRLTRGIATEFLAFERLASSLPTVDEILSNPLKAKVPGKDKLDALFAISGAVAAKTTRSTMNAIVKYIERLPNEYQIVWLKDSLQYDKSIIGSKEFKEVIASHSSTFAEVQF